MGKRCLSPPFDKNKTLLHYHKTSKISNKMYNRKQKQLNMDFLIGLIGKYILSKIKCKDTHKDEYLNTEEIKSLDGNHEYPTSSPLLPLQKNIKSRNGKLFTTSIGQDSPSVHAHFYLHYRWVSASCWNIRMDIEISLI